MKKNNNELKDGEKYENLFEVFIRNYKNVKGIRMICRLFIYFILFLILLVIGKITVYVNNNNNINKDNSDVISTTKIAKKTFVELLDNLNNITKTYCSIDNNGVSYKFIYDKNMEGYLESNDATKHIKINNNIAYEVKLDNLIETDSLSNYNINYFNIYYLIDLFKSNMATTINEELFIKKIYNIDNIEYIVEYNNENISSISINDNNIKYSFIFDF